MSGFRGHDDHHPYSKRADVAPLHEALHSPSPLGNILDNIHRSNSKNGERSRSDSYTLSPMIPANLNDDTLSGRSVKSDYSLFGAEGSIGSSVVVSTIVSGVHRSISHWKILLFGQVISFFFAVAGAASEEMNKTCNVSIPLTQTTLVGFVLMLFGASRMRGWCAGCCLHREGKERGGDLADEEKSFYQGSGHSESRSSIRSPLNNDNDGDSSSSGNRKSVGFASDRGQHPIAKLRMAPPRTRSFCWGLQNIHAPWWVYFLTGLAAVEGRYFMFLAFRYTSFSFIYLVDALAIPSAMSFSKCLLGRSYKLTHVLGGILSMAGIILSTVSDLKSTEIENIGTITDIDSRMHLRGDIIAVSGALLMGLDDVLSEMLIRKHNAGPDEVLFVKWFFGLQIAIVQLIVLERESLMALINNQGGETCDLSMIYLLLGIFVVVISLVMMGEVRFLSISEAALLNLSTLTSNLWATAFSIFAEGIMPSGGYFAAFLLIIFGIVLYEAGPSPIGDGTPLEVKIKMQPLESEITKVAASRMQDEKTGGHLEMT